MKKRHNIPIAITSLLLVLSGCTCIYGQDLYFSQFHEAPMVRNPALAGLFKGDIRVQSVYRNQWNSISYPYQSGSLNAEYKFPIGRSDDFITAGTQFLFDKAGTVGLGTYHLLPAVNYHKSLSESRNMYLSLGFMGGPVSRRLDRSRVTTDNQYDGFTYNGSLPDGEYFNSSYTYLDANVGMSLNSTLGSEEQHLFFIGVAYHHLNKPVNSFYRNINHLPKWVFSAGLKLEITPISNFTFHGDYLRQWPHQQTIFGGIYSHTVGEDEGRTFNVHGGMMARWGDAIIPMLKLDMLPYTLAFSYDITVGKLATLTNARGGFEISITYVNFLRSDQSNEYATKCPKF